MQPEMTQHFYEKQNQLIRRERNKQRQKRELHSKKGFTEAKQDNDRKGNRQRQRIRKKNRGKHAMTKRKTQSEKQRQRKRKVQRKNKTNFRDTES